MFPLYLHYKQNTFRYVLFLPFLLFTHLFSCTPKKSEAVSDNKRPNIIFILVDDMRWDEYGLGGHNYIKTPNIDRLSQEGVTFKNAFATTPLCSPSRASFLTGQYAHTNGIINNEQHNELSHQLQTFPRDLHDHGYETAFIGKWHMGNDDTARPGFDEWIALKGQGEAIDPSLNINGERKVVKGYVTDIFTDYSIQFITKKRSAPFLLYLSHKALHPNYLQRDDGSVVAIDGGGFIAAERHKGMYANDIFQRRPNANIIPSDKPALARQIDTLPPLSPQTATPEKDIRQRAEMLMAVDDGLGKIMETLQENGMLENTIIVFTSDHGYWYGEHCLNEERRLAYEEGIRIPLFVRYPASFPGGSSVNNFTLSIDIAPTLLEAAGITPDNRYQGKSFLSILNNENPNWRKSFLVEYYSDRVFPRVVKMGYKAVRTDRYKFIHYVDLDGMDELYDLQTDPYEIKNIIDDPSMDSVNRQMKEELNYLLMETGAPPVDW